MKRSFTLKILIAAVFLIATILISLTFGAVPLNIASVLKDTVAKKIFFSIRLPRTLLVALCGASLAAAGATFQMFFQNDLADPSVIGISSAGVFGAVLAATVIPTAINKINGVNVAEVTTNIARFTPVVSLVMCIMATVTLLAISRGADGSSTLLCGVAMGCVFSALSSALLLTHPNNIYSVYTALLGSFSAKGYDALKVVTAPIIVSLFFMIVSAPRLTLLISGEVVGRALGLKVKRLWIMVLLSVSLSLSAVTAISGVIGFVGLITPHLIKRIGGVGCNSGLRLVALSIIYGAAFLLLCDTVARTVIAPAELPTGIITALFGAPFFLIVAVIKKREESQCT